MLILLGLYLFGLGFFCDRTLWIHESGDGLVLPVIMIVFWPAFIAVHMTIEGVRWFR